MDYWFFENGKKKYDKMKFDSEPSLIYQIKKNSESIIIANYITLQFINDIKNYFKGILVLTGDFNYLANMIFLTPSIDKQIFALKTEYFEDQGNHTRFLILNFTNKKKYYQKVLENYSYCPSCNKTSKDYGGKKHHYRKEGTWIRDVWNRSEFSLPLIENDEFGQLISNIANFQLNEYYTINQSKVTLENNQNVEISKKKKYKTFDIQRINNQNCINGDSDEVLDFLLTSDKKYDLIFCDPPYNVGKKYSEHKDNMNQMDYNNWIINLYLKGADLLNDNGLFWILNTPYNNLIHYLALSEKLHFVGEIVWDDLGVPAAKIQPTYYNLLVFSKSPHVKNSQLIIDTKDPKYCKRNSCIKNRKKIISTPSSIWGDIFRIRHNKKRWGHPCNLPIEFLDRVFDISLKIIGNNSLNILDFFAGIGTTAMSSMKNGHISTNIELDSSYFKIILQRIENKLYENNETKIKKKNKGKTKKSIQLDVANALKVNSSVINLNLNERVEWLLARKVISEEDISLFRSKSELFRSIGKTGVKESNTKGNKENKITSLDDYF